MAGGQPTKYKKAYTLAAEDYLKTWNVIEGGFEHAYPSQKGFLTHHGIPRSTSDGWKKAHPEYSYILDQIKALGEHVLCDKGLKDEVKPIMAKFILSSRFDYREKTENKEEVSGGLTVTWEK